MTFLVDSSQPSVMSYFTLIVETRENWTTAQNGARGVWGGREEICCASPPYPSPRASRLPFPSHSLALKN